ncbi:hypothetical protein ASPNIDRAFT_201497 [Aspergillus niger ATCC 1015]|uniref:Pyridoxamine 5'-phosphate oxidase Alr4036 family FMN-binding domain-containing protein n=1 Tax=Aspergillus niger (strain ATCC 1015 / CBS 113.46 / FGSC A1144 / LSHB Ac4 / NCTC 3858a / NRRL 328 / USDA 3528.7) TaxID=380704 RepID=G3XP59_ASPNA|nr:hypothetical protein ASPNIDRAFT_201497 [Aspergillus niger ATCC 1015]KAI2964599.1 hypothetical protein CBS147323_6298 [Aspergillus niger]KAI3019676.1 hypothetical protein CBS147345_3919 [Aspergillus niger]KAI3029857.1 hypothetical protein CBS147347_3088 [Aspergillus niger]KAI3072258.1 hypothetical protein CBS147353_6167 [Aspergillus niger]
MPPKPAPYLPLLSSHLTSSPTSTSISLTTLSTHPITRTPQPRSRTVEFRGFFPTLNLHSSAVQSLKDQHIGLNPDIYESEMIALTTDKRMEKVQEMESSGGVVEAVFWLKEVGNQWRVRGRGVIIGGDPEDQGEKEGRGFIEKGLRRKEDGGNGEGDGEWSWERQVDMYFANHSPGMRGTFKNPPPGTLRSQDPGNPELKLGQKVEDLKDKVARENFRVVVIRPEEVERLDVNDPSNPIRTRWTAVRDGEEWEEVDLWP